MLSEAYVILWKNRATGRQSVGTEFYTSIEEVRHYVDVARDEDGRTGKRYDIYACQLKRLPG